MNYQKAIFQILMSLAALFFFFDFYTDDSGHPTNALMFAICVGLIFVSNRAKRALIVAIYPNGRKYIVAKFESRREAEKETNTAITDYWLRIKAHQPPEVLTQITFQIEEY